MCNPRTMETLDRLRYLAARNHCNKYSRLGSGIFNRYFPHLGVEISSSPSVRGNSHSLPWQFSVLILKCGDKVGYYFSGGGEGAVIMMIRAKRDPMGCWNIHSAHNLSCVMKTSSLAPV